MFHEMNRSDLVKFDLEWKHRRCDQSSQRINQAGYTIHSAITQAPRI